jgi:hypothetical protein
MRLTQLGFAGAALAVAITCTALVSGCTLTVGALPGSAPAAPAAAGATSPAAPVLKAGHCVPHGTSIPAGHYVGKVAVTIKTTMTLTGDGISIPNAGSGQEAWKGTVDVTSTGSTVSGTMTLSELGLSQVGASGGTQVHSVENSDFAGTISGTAAKPVVIAHVTGEWASLDAPLINGKGTTDQTVAAGLHIIHADCQTITGNAVAMFADIASPVKQYLAISGSGTWTATRD